MVIHWTLNTKQRPSSDGIRFSTFPYAFCSHPFLHSHSIDSFIILIPTQKYTIGCLHSSHTYIGYQNIHPFFAFYYLLSVSIDSPHRIRTTYIKRKKKNMKNTKEMKMKKKRISKANKEKLTRHSKSIWTMFQVPTYGTSNKVPTNSLPIYTKILWTLSWNVYE